MHTSPCIIYDLISLQGSMNGPNYIAEVYSFFFAPLFNESIPIPTVPTNNTNDGPRKIPHPPFFNTTDPTGLAGANDTSSVAGSDNTKSDGSDVHSSTDNSTTTEYTETVGGSILNASVIMLITFPLVGLAAYYAAALSKKAIEDKKENIENMEASHRIMSSDDMESPPVDVEEEKEGHSSKGISNAFSRTSGYSPAGSEDVLFEHPSISI